MNDANMADDLGDNLGSGKVTTSEKNEVELQDLGESYNRQVSSFADYGIKAQPEEMEELISGLGQTSDQE